MSQSAEDDTKSYVTVKVLGHLLLMKDENKISSVPSPVKHPSFTAKRPSFTKK